MRFARLALAHARIAGRQRSLWVASALLALLALAVMVNTGMPFETGNVGDLAFYAQMLVLLPPVVYAAACTDLASAPARLGIGEVEDASPVLAVQLAGARVAGTLAVFALPSAVLLLICGCGQAAHGNPWGPLQALGLFAGVVVPAALLAMALSALAGAALPRVLARVAAVAGWCAVLLLTAFANEPTEGGGLRTHLVADPVCQAFFGSAPLLDHATTAASATPLQAVVLLAAKLALAAGLLVVASMLARRRSFRRG